MIQKLTRSFYREVMTKGGEAQSAPTYKGSELQNALANIKLSGDIAGEALSARYTVERKTAIADITLKPLMSIQHLVRSELKKFLRPNRRH